MRKFAAITIAGLCVTAWLAPLSAATETITGTVVDLACYVRNKSFTSRDHGNSRECAYACTRWEGQPVGIVTGDGKVYQFAGGLTANSNVKIAAHLSHTVSVTGEVTDKDGMMMISANDVTMVK